MAINDTQDLFFLILAISVGVLTFFMAWLLWYIVSMLRTASHVIQSVDEKLRLIEDILHSLKENVGNGSAALMLLTKTVARLVHYGVEKKNARKAKNTKTSSGGGKKGAQKAEAENGADDFFENADT